MRNFRGLVLTTVLTIGLGILAGCGAGKPTTKNLESAAPKEVAKNNEAKNQLVVNIGIQQSIWPILAAKEKGWFEEEFKKVGAQVIWVEFQSGPAYFEAIASDRLDFGRVGNIPVLAGQAADIKFKEIATASFGEKGDSILVPKDSPIKTIQDLKGKQIAVAKASSSYGLLYKALEFGGLKPDDVKIIQLQPDEAQPAFETGKVDAWAIWEPFQSVQVLKNGARVLANGNAVKSYSPGFQIVRTNFAEEHPELVVLYLKVTEKATKWQLEHVDEAIELYAKLKKQDKETIRRVLENSEPANVPITPEVIKTQQNTAELLQSVGGLKGKVEASKVVDNSYIEKALQELKSEKK
ncbi:aliphatic sulfonate ABC transporter substrate-binding protein [Paenibacillus sp. V4I7]|uniref:aliphatic sulfonate ABC transporter substrate-binding protein n=1 Tax=Paenibacillus sp. V4I7 TaxID=3042307 RepID=UPI00278A6BBD|nr:aliphatic sulfonate ABC transporter substrate-binding protein [Paenibacillus sp. V4I7]MDQ0901230.1 sulfonate transport system substrate-binding protein [Paenibacillus sp. V4I7]